MARENGKGCKINVNFLVTPVSSQDSQLLDFLEWDPFFITLSRLEMKPILLCTLVSLVDCYIFKYGGRGEDNQNIRPLLSLGAPLYLLSHSLILVFLHAKTTL